MVLYCNAMNFMDAWPVFCSLKVLSTVFEIMKRGDWLSELLRYKELKGQ